MKKLIIPLLIVCLLLGACAMKEETPTTIPTTEPTTTVPTTEATEPPTTVPVLRYRHPLNGTLMEQPWTGRPVAVVLNNIKSAMPQHGVGDADILYEIETEGGITRCLGIYSDVSGISAIGPIRSARTFFNNVALSYDAPIIHCGGSVRGRKGGYADSSDRISGWAHIDQVANGKFFYRDADRKAAGYAYEHRLFSTGALLTEGLQKKNYSDATERSCDFGLNFDSAVTLAGSPANTVTVSFLGRKTTTMTYNPATGLYEAAQYDAPYIDGNTGNVITFKNVMILTTSQWKKDDGEYLRSYYDLEGSGNGLLAIDGQIVPIMWTKDALRTSFSYTLMDGTPITLAEGHTYIAITSTKATPVAYS